MQLVAEKKYESNRRETHTSRSRRMFGLSRASAAPPLTVPVTSSHSLSLLFSLVCVCVCAQLKKNPLRFWSCLLRTRISSFLLSLSLSLSLRLAILILFLSSSLLLVPRYHHRSLLLSPLLRPSLSSSTTFELRRRTPCSDSFTTSEPTCSTNCFTRHCGA